MKLSLLDKLACPACSADFEVRSFRSNTPASWEEIQDGVLLCKGCKNFYIISHYIPRLLPQALNNDQDFARRYELELKEIKSTYHNPATDITKSFLKLKQDTQRNFGFEWQEWSSFGWGDEVSMAQTHDIFAYKVLVKPGELTGKLVLDGGCGNGRYTQAAADFGGEIIGVDLSEAADVAFQNTKNNPKIHIIQGDLFNLPFKKNLFDFIFSNGVLMHTGNAKKAFLNLTTHLKDSGAITIHLYHRGNIVYEFNDRWLRAITTRLPLSWVFAWSKALAKTANVLPRKFVDYGLNTLLRIERHPHYVFDWYTAPIATHHTYHEVYDWLKEAKLHLVADHNVTKYPWRKWILPFFFLTVKAAKNAPTNGTTHTLS